MRVRGLTAGDVGLDSFFGRGKVAPASIRDISGSSRVGFGRAGRSFAGFRRGRVPNLSAVAFVSRDAIKLLSMPPSPVGVTGELSLGRRPRVAYPSVRFGGVVGAAFVGVVAVFARITLACLPEARNFAAGDDPGATTLGLLRIGAGLSGVFAFRLDV